MNGLIAAIYLLMQCLALWLQIPTPIDAPSSVDYEVYSEVLRVYYATDQVKHIVIGNHTMMEFPPVMMGMSEPGESEQMKKIREALAKETLNDYVEKNKSPVLLENKFSLRVPVVLISESERDRIFGVKGEGEKKTASPDGFQELNRLYPNSQGFMNLSRIAYNTQKTQAFVYVGNVCGGLCGTGQFFLLVKDGTRWKIKYTATKWVS